MEDMFSPCVRVTRVKPQAILPKYATAGAAAMDVYACIDEPVTVPVGGRVLIPSGIAIELPSRNYVAILCARSGTAFKHGICLANGIGVIDSDYRGEIGVALVNLSDTPYPVQPNERIAQLMIQPVCTAMLTETDTLGETKRGEGGFGSTGKQ